MFHFLASGGSRITALRGRQVKRQVVAHDLKSPLTAILGYAELVRDEVADLLAAAVPMLDKVVATSRRMCQLIDDLLTYA